MIDIYYSRTSHIYRLCKQPISVLFSFSTKQLYKHYILFLYGRMVFYNQDIFVLILIKTGVLHFSYYVYQMVNTLNKIFFYKEYVIYHLLQLSTLYYYHILNNSYGNTYNCDTSKQYFKLAPPLRFERRSYKLTACRTTVVLERNLNWYTRQDLNLHKNSLENWRLIHSSHGCIKTSTMFSCQRELCYCVPDSLKTTILQGFINSVIVF